MKTQAQLKQDVAQYISNSLDFQEQLIFGSGSTINAIIQAGSPKITQAASSSNATTLMLKQANIQEVTLNSINPSEPSICIDGADQIIEGNQMIIKGHGGALLREKISWGAAKTIIVAIDESKLSKRISKTIPIVISSFGISAIQKAVEEIDTVYTAILRQYSNLPFITDDGNMILDLSVDSSTKLEVLDQQLHRIPGVLETGIFIPEQFDLTIYCATQDGILKI